MQVLSVILNRSLSANNYVLPLALRLLSTAGDCHAQGGGGEKTTRQPTKKETIHSPPKTSSSGRAITAQDIRFDGAYRLVLPRGKCIHWFRFLPGGDVIFIKTEDFTAKSPRDCLTPRGTIDSPYCSSSCDSINKWCRSTLVSLGPNNFEFSCIDANWGKYTGTFRGNRLYLRYENSDVVFPSLPVDFVPMTFNENLLSVGVLNEKAIFLAQPFYSPYARSKHASGQVVVQVVVDENGNVISALAVSGDEPLRGTAAEAACSSRFSPFKISGRLTKVTGVITYNFVPD